MHTESPESFDTEKPDIAPGIGPFACLGIAKGRGKGSDGAFPRPEKESGSGDDRPFGSGGPVSAEQKGITGPRFSRAFPGKYSKTPVTFADGG